jgi:catalase
MPLPNDEKLIALSEEILKQFEANVWAASRIQAGPCQGHFIDGDVYTVSSLTRAQHAVQASTPVTVRFSDATGVPLIPDNGRRGRTAPEQSV